MPLDKDAHIIIQARSGSSRLKNKMLLPFYQEKTILEVMVANLLKYFSASQIILATTINEKDDELEKIAEKLQIKCFRGQEQNVLERFIGAAEFFNIENLIRICADNPLLQAAQIKNLSCVFLEKDVDYLSYAFPDGTPTIKSHVGLFGEATTLKALKKVKALTVEKFYLEHVTNYIYENPEQFKVEFLTLPENLQKRKDLRLTIDTQEDFNTVKEIFEHNIIDRGYEVSTSQILNYLNQNKHLLKTMANEIERNSK